MPRLTLYHSMSCPYCAKVRDYLSQQGINIPMKDIHALAGAREELITIGGKGQVPCLGIDGKALYESLDILEWFKTNYVK